MGLVADKPCVACKKPIAEAFAICSFCKAEQPRVSAPPKEVRCARCKRPHSARLRECPFCLRQGGASVPPREPPLVPAPEAVPETASREALINVAIFGGPLLGLALWGAHRWFSTERLGGHESSGLMIPAAAFGIVLALGLAAGYVRRAYGPLGDAIADEGAPRIVTHLLVATVLFSAPASLVVYGVASWINTFGMTAHEEDVVCVADSVRQGARGGWDLSYSCPVEGGTLRGEVRGLASKPEVAEEEPFRFRGVRGALGIWLRLSDPLPPKPEI